MKAIKNTTYDLTVNDAFGLAKCRNLINEIITDFEENNATLIESPITGEVITLDELRRMKGIISGLLGCEIWRYQ